MEDRQEGRKEGAGRGIQGDNIHVQHSFGVLLSTCSYKTTQVANPQ